jgi:hypothetical protein
MKNLLAAAFVLGLAGAAHAQGFGKGDMRDRDRIPWVRGGLDRAIGGGDNLNNPLDKRRLKQEAGDKKYIFVYIRGTNEETMEPREVSNCADAVDAARGAWLFVLVDFDKENAHQKAWKVTSAPALVGCDIYGNDFMRLGGSSIDTIRNIIKGTPVEVQKYEAKLKYDFQKASDAIAGDTDKGAKMFVDICINGRVGYKEVSESHAKLNELGEAAFKKTDLAAAVSPEMAIDYLEDLVKIYRSTGPGAKAEVMLALLDHARNNVPAAITRLAKILKYDARSMKAEIDLAQKALEEISKAGDAKIEAALAGDRTAAKDVLRKLAKDYQGTEAGKHAADLAK